MHYLLALVFLFFSLPSVAQINPGCVIDPLYDNHVDCDLIASSEPIGVGVAPGRYATFTNRTTSHLQINEARAETNETGMWSEFCLYYDDYITAQSAPGKGEVGCATKNVGESYPPVTFGNGTGLSVPPGGVVYFNSNTYPTKTNHTYSLMVANQTTGLHSWRQPIVDTVHTCNGQQQSTPWSPWQNTTGRDLHLTGSLIYSESGNAASKNTVSVAACIYIYRANGTQRYANCDAALQSRGPVALPMQLVADGEYVVAQAANVCPAGQAAWDWAAFLHIW